MKITRWWMIPAVVGVLLTAGCYTQFYRPGMEQAGTGPYDQLYDRYDSTAIDTTLTSEDWSGTGTYPEDRWDNWYSWGGLRRHPRWGFDFDAFSPGYYWSYYGYYDYYGVPWWHTWYDPWYWGGPGYGTVPGEPPSRRHPRLGDTGGSGMQNPPATSPPESSPAYRNPPSQQPNSGGTKKSDEPQQRPPRRGGR